MQSIYAIYKLFTTILNKNLHIQNNPVTFFMAKSRYMNAVFERGQVIDVLSCRFRINFKR